MPPVLQWKTYERYMKGIWKVYERYMPLFPCRPQSHLEHLTAVHDHTCQMISNHQRLRPAEGRRRPNDFQVPLNLWSLISENMFLMNFFRSIPWTGSSVMTKDDLKLSNAQNLWPALSNNEHCPAKYWHTSLQQRSPSSSTLGSVTLWAEEIKARYWGYEGDYRTEFGLRVGLFTLNWI